MFSAVEGAKNISSIVDDSSIIKLGLFDYKKLMLSENDLFLMVISHPESIMVMRMRSHICLNYFLFIIGH